MLSLFEAAASTPAVGLHFEFTTAFDTCLPPTLPAKLRGAFHAAMKRITASCEGADADRGRRAISSLRPISRKLVLSEGKSPFPLHSTQYLLGVPWTPQPVGPDTVASFEVLLLGDAAELWDIWALAAVGLIIEDVPLQCRQAAVISDFQLHPLERFSGDPAQAIGAVADFAGAHPADTDRETVDAVRIHLLTPTCWDQPANYDPAAELNLPRFIESAFTRLSMVSGVAPIVAEQELRDAILPSQIRISANRVLASVQAARSAKSQGGTRMRYGGLIGHFDIRRAVDRPAQYGLPADLLDLLWLLQATHLGREPAFGCGRIRVEVLA